MKLNAFIVCEDIRAETGNKNSLMGVLNGSLAFAGQGKDEWPKSANLAAFIRIAVEEGDQVPSKFSFTATLNGEEIANSQSPVVVPEGIKLFNIPVTMSGFPLKSTGRIVFNFKLFHKKSILIEAEDTLDIALVDES